MSKKLFYEENDYFEEFPPYDNDKEEFGGDDYFESIASYNECTGLIPNGLADDFQGEAYNDLYRNIHQPKGQDPEKTEAPQKDVSYK